MAHPLLIPGILAAFLWPNDLKAPGEFVAGEWRGSAGYKDAKFELCEMHVDRGQWRVFIGIGRDNRPLIGFGHRNMEFEKDLWIKGQLHIDGGPAVPIRVKGIRKRVVRGLIPPEGLERLLTARHFRLSLGEVFADLETGAIHRAWPALQYCAATRGSR